ncbi:12082_t:CDS:2 [Rhizophagus irregularis]|nr:12082_t:CDS:2 [Rhizophagus irregularis]
MRYISVTQYESRTKDTTHQSLLGDAITILDYVGENIASDNMNQSNHDQVNLVHNSTSK